MSQEVWFKPSYSKSCQPWRKWVCTLSTLTCPTRCLCRESSRGWLWASPTWSDVALAPATATSQLQFSPISKCCLVPMTEGKYPVTYCIFARRYYRTKFILDTSLNNPQWRHFSTDFGTKVPLSEWSCRSICNLASSEKWTNIKASLCTRSGHNLTVMWHWPSGCYVNSSLTVLSSAVLYELRRAQMKRICIVSH